MARHRFTESLKFAWRGILFALRTERNMVIHCVGAGLAILACILLKVSRTEWLIICLTAALVLVMEIMNTAIEVLVDYLSRERRAHPKVIKDLAAGAVLTATGISIIVGGTIFIPKIIALFH